MNELKTVYHHEPDDSDCCYDYCAVSVWLNNECLAAFGDYYHDKGHEKAQLICEILMNLIPGLNKPQEESRADAVDLICPEKNIKQYKDFLSYRETEDGAG